MWDMKILMNAEAFGFGPSTMMVKLYHEITMLSSHLLIDYIGSGHTLDLHKKLPYHHIYDVSEEEEFKKIVVQYDFFITALDFEKAAWAQDMGVKTIIYDNLTWYWRKFPKAIHQSFYVAHNFYGVAKTLKEQKVSNYALVSSMSHDLVVNKSKKDKILINFGGLENPIWDKNVTIEYVRKILDNLLPLLNHEKVVLLASHTHVKALPQYPLKTLSKKGMDTLLPKVKYAFMTPGLGNILDSVHYEFPVCFLPPANDSQGQQLRILKNKKLVDCDMDWSVFEKHAIDYNAPQKEVLSEIKKRIMELNNKTLSRACVESILKLQKINFSHLPLMKEDPELQGTNNLSPSMIMLNYMMKEKGLLENSAIVTLKSEVIQKLKKSSNPVQPQFIII